MPPKKTWEESEDSSSEEESVSPPPVAVRRKFEDEEDSDDVADNWEEAEDSEVERERAARAAAVKAKADAEAAANKKSKSQRVEEHREAARRRRAAGEEEDEEDSSEDEDEAEKRARLRQSEQDSDLKHAQDLFDNVGLGPKSRAAPNKAVIIEDKTKPGHTIDLSSLALFKPATKSQFEALSAALVPLLVAASNKPHYSLWLQDFVKKIAADMPSGEIKRAASALTALTNEKMKEEKAMDKSGKKTKAAKSKASLAAGRDVGRGVADTTSYEADLADDDFM